MLNGFKPFPRGPKLLFAKEVQPLLNFFTKNFLKHLVVSNGLLVVVIIIYNLLTFLLPLVKLSLFASIGTLLLVDLIICALKGFHIFLNQQF